MIHSLTSSFAALSMCLLVACAGEDAFEVGEVDALAQSADEPRPPPSYTSFDTALRVEANGQPPLTDEVHAEQVDYYVFAATAGEFYEVSTETGMFSPDNVMSLFDADRREIAANDDGARFPGGDQFDARVVFRAPKTGDYYVRVEDLKTPPQFFESAFPLLFYHLSVRKISASTTGYAPASEGLTAADFVPDPRSGYRSLTVIGSYGDEATRIDLPGVRDHALIARYHLGGARGDGSSTEHAEVRVRAPDGHLLSAIDCTEAQPYFRPPIGAGTHQIELRRHGEPGDNPFYVVDLVLLPDNPREKNEASNGEPGGAEPLALSRGAFGRALLLAEVPQGDVDYFEIPAQSASSVMIGCEGEPMGSGVRDLEAALLDPSGQVLHEAQEGEDGLEFTSSLSSALPHYLRLSSVGTPSEPIAPWVRCVVIVQ